MRELLDTEGTESDDPCVTNCPSPWDTESPAPIFGRAAEGTPMHSYLPSNVDGIALWTIYKDNISPVVPIFHRSSLETLFDYKNSNIFSADDESVLFSIYLAAVVSISSEHCSSLLHDTKAEMLARYRRCTQLSLDRAN